MVELLQKVPAEYRQSPEATKSLCKALSIALAAVAASSGGADTLETTLDRDVAPIERNDPLGSDPLGGSPLGGAAAPAAAPAEPATAPASDPLAQ